MQILRCARGQEQESVFWQTLAPKAAVVLNEIQAFGFESKSWGGYRFFAILAPQIHSVA
jgi:hypothetical protein